MLLGQTKDGKVYQSASHRTDGAGFEDAITEVDVRDVMLESPVVRANQEIDAHNQMLNKVNLFEKLYDERKNNQNNAIMKKLNCIKNATDEAVLDSRVQEQLKYLGIKQNLTAKADFDQLEIAGYGLSSDGTIGPNKKDMAIERALMQQMGNVPQITDETFVYDDIEYHEVDSFEKKQYNLTQEAEALKSKFNEQAFTNQATVEKPASSVPAVMPDTQTPIIVKRKTKIPVKWLLIGLGAYLLLQRR